MKLINILILPLLLTGSLVFNAFETKPRPDPQTNTIITGADQTEKYLSYLQGKRVGILGNPTTILGTRHLVDSLLALGIKVTKVFGPEHGFRGKASAGISVGDEKDSATGVSVISLYGPKRKPSKEDMADLDIMIFDIQDVGCRFYTYINVLGEIMDACAENNKELMILDRPNPNGYFVDGPILDMKLKSGIGKYPVPITHGMTIGEFAQMINGEGWLPNKATCKLKIIKVANYTHDMPYTLPVKPSPNLNSQHSIMLYPTICLFEGTIISQGRGTYMPFSVLGAPALKGKYSFTFKPVSIKGMSETPLHMNEMCYGIDYNKIPLSELRKSTRINIQWLIDFYKAYPEKEKFFDRTQNPEVRNFDLLAGVYELKKQIIAGASAKEIYASWEPGLSQYKTMRAKYLLYK